MRRDPHLWSDRPRGARAGRRHGRLSRAAALALTCRLHGQRILEQDLDDDGAPDVVPLRVAGGPTLLQVTHHACHGGSPVELFRLVRSRPVSVGRFDPEDRKNASGLAETDDGFRVKLLCNAAGQVEALDVSCWNTTRRHVFTRGRFRPEAVGAARGPDPADALLDLGAVDAMAEYPEGAIIEAMNRVLEELGSRMVFCTLFGSSQDSWYVVFVSPELADRLRDQYN